MQDRAIVAIGEWQLEEKKDLEPVDLYIENMYPGNLKDFGSLENTNSQYFQSPFQQNKDSALRANDEG